MLKVSLGVLGARVALTILEGRREVVSELGVVEVDAFKVWRRREVIGKTEGCACFGQLHGVRRVEQIDALRDQEEYCRRRERAGDTSEFGGRQGGLKNDKR